METQSESASTNALVSWEAWAATRERAQILVIGETTKCGSPYAPLYQVWVTWFAQYENECGGGEDSWRVEGAGDTLGEAINAALGKAALEAPEIV